VPDQPPKGRRAADVLTADLERRPGGKALHGVRLAAAFAAEMALGLLPGPPVSDVVVRRREGGAEVLRVPAGDTTLPGDMLRYVRQQLDTPGVEEFLEEWRA
jgi:hypothetical protein